MSLVEAKVVFVELVLFRIRSIFAIIVVLLDKVTVLENKTFVQSTQIVKYHRTEASVIEQAQKSLALLHGQAFGVGALMASFHGLEDSIEIVCGAVELEIFDVTKLSVSVHGVQDIVAKAHLNLHIVFDGF